jgi:hypothetical protein
MSTFDSSELIFTLVDLQFTKQISPNLGLGLPDIYNLRCVSRFFRNEPVTNQLKSSIIKQRVTDFTSQMFAGLYENLLWVAESRNNESCLLNGIVGISSQPTAEVVRGSENSFYLTLTKTSPVVSSIQSLTTTLNLKKNVIIILSLNPHYCQEVRLCASSDQDHYRGVIDAVSYRTEISLITHFKVGRSSPLDVHKLIMKGLSITERGGNDSDDSGDDSDDD